ncbi:MAG: ATP-binding protein [Microbacterium sp.]
MTGIPRPLRTTGWTLAIVGALLLIAAAAAADTLRGWGIWAVVLDIAVGAAFLACCATCIAGGLSRALCAAVGVLWLVGSLVPVLATSHRAALAICLVVFPAARIRGVLAWTLVMCSVPAALGAVPQAAVAALFAAIAIARAVLVGRRAESPPVGRGASAVAAAGAAGVALVLAAGTIGGVAGAPSAAVILGAYQLLLIAIAAALIASTRLRPARRQDLPDALLSIEPSGIAGLEQLLRALLRDPDLRIDLAPDAGLPRTASGGQTPGVPADDLTGELRTVAVVDGGITIAEITHRAGSIADDRTLRSVLEATRLTAINERTTASLEYQQREIRAARRRLRDAGERRRRELVARLHDDVLTPIARARVAVDAAGPLVRSDEGRASLALVSSELAGTEHDLRATAAGTATQLGSGRLHDELHALAARHPSVIARVDAGALGDQASEDALRYVASELVANALKHAGAEHVVVRLRRVGDDLELEVRDDGIGGADPHGSGIDGLRRRIAPLGGRLRIASVRASGTAVTAVIPVNPASSRALR